MGFKKSLKNTVIKTVKTKEFKKLGTSYFNDGKKGLKDEAIKIIIDKLFKI